MRTPFDKALELVLTSDVSPATGRRQTEKSCGFVLSEDVRVREDLPPFDNSAMDGYAVRREDLQGATDEDPVRLSVVGEIAAGDEESNQMSLHSGEAIRIFTGAPVPEDADTVVIQERVERTDEGSIIIDHEPDKGNIRFRGEEMKKGETLLEKGTVLTPAAIGSLLGQGVLEISVYNRPDVGILSTGEELIDYHEIPDPGQIRDTNRPMLKIALEEMGISSDTARVGDRPERIKKKMAEFLETRDVLLVVGGMSVGDHDHVRDILMDLGVEKIFWKVNQKPGKPVYFGRRDDVYVLGFPGNPVSNLVCFYLYGVPLIRRFSGFSNDRALLRRGRTVLENPVEKREKRVEFLRAVTRMEGGQYRSRRLQHQGSHMLSGLARANSLVKIPEGSGTTKGDRLEVYFLPDG